MRQVLERWRTLGPLVALAAALGAGGCSPPTATVSGTVKAPDGTVLKGGSVVFYDADGKTYRSEIDENGKYTIEKVPPGKVTVTVDTSMLKAASQARVNPAPPDAKGGGQKQTDPAEAAKRYVPIPPGYADPQSSGLTYTVTAGSQTYDPPLK